MALRTTRDIQQAVAAGRVHQQRILKNVNATGADGAWWDWSFASGQPAYDARIGTSLAFNPAIAAGNDAVFFPPIASGQERQLAGVSIRPNASGTIQVGVTCEIYDLLGYYPLIDGDSGDPQELTNTQSLPRYESGDGVIAVLVNHVAPMVSAANATMTYTSCDGSSKTIDIRAALTGQNRVCSAVPTTGGAGPIQLPRASGCGGVRSVQSIQWTSTPPGGLFAIYLVKMLCGVVHYDDSYNVAITGGGKKHAVEKCNCLHNAWNMPRIYDGAHLGMFVMTSAGSRQFDLYGNFTFIWG